MQNKIAIGVDIGGTHITCSGVNLVHGQLLETSLFRAEYNHNDAAPSILRYWAAALNQSLLVLDEAQLAGIGFAIPGGLIIGNGISKMQHKFPHLIRSAHPYGVESITPGGKGSAHAFFK